VVGGAEDFRRAEAFEFGEEGGWVIEFGGMEASGGEVDEGEAECGPDGADGGEEVMAVGFKQSIIEMGAGAEDLCDGALDEVSRARVFDLVAEGDFFSCAQEAADVSGGGVIGDAAHGGGLALSECDVEQLGAGACVVEEQLVEIAEAEEQECIGWELGFDAAVLQHHGGEMGVGAHARMETSARKRVVEGKTVAKQMSNICRKDWSCEKVLLRICADARTTRHVRAKASDLFKRGHLASTIKPRTEVNPCGCQEKDCQEEGC
jgi:hypothetical protein